MLQNMEQMQQKICTDSIHINFGEEVTSRKEERERGKATGKRGVSLSCSKNILFPRRKYLSEANVTKY